MLARHVVRNRIKFLSRFNDAERERRFNENVDEFDSLAQHREVCLMRCFKFIILLLNCKGHTIVSTSEQNKKAKLEENGKFKINKTEFWSKSLTFFIDTQIDSQKLAKFRKNS